MQINCLAKPVALTFLALSCVCARAQDIYVEGSADQLGLLNPLNGAYTSIGTTTERIGGFASVGGTLYGLADDDNLYSINPSTAALTLIGNTGITHGGYGLGETSNGTVYAILQNTNLYTLNTSTAAPTFMGFSTNSDPSGDATGGLYDAQGADGNGIYSINPATGAGTLLGTDSIGTVLALAYVNGIMFAMNTTGSIYDINLTNGSATFQTSYDVSTVGSVYAAGVEVVPSLAPSGVPEPGGLSLIIGAAITASGFAIRKRRVCISHQGPVQIE